jgi:hypothetical protein
MAKHGRSIGPERANGGSGRRAWKARRSRHKSTRPRPAAVVVFGCRAAGGDTARRVCAAARNRV